MVTKNPNPSYGLNHMWGTCPHVVSAKSKLVPATMTPATCTLAKPAVLVPAKSNGFEVMYTDPLFGEIKTQSFSAKGVAN